MKLLVIPGIGDIHWVALKLQAFIARYCPGQRPEVWIWDFDGRRRSAEFVRRLPFVTFGGYWEHPIEQPIFDAHYLHGTADVSWGFHGFDSFLCVNGSLRVGRPWGDILPDLATDWRYPIVETPEDAADGERFAAGGPFALLYFSDHGMFKHWIRRLPASEIGPFIDRLGERLGCRMVLTGSSWDAGFVSQIRCSAENLVGQTSLGQLLAMVRRARAFVGWCGGNTIVSTHLGTPTLMLWSDYFRDRGFQTNWVAPDAIGRVYRAMDVEDFDEDAAIAAVEAMRRG